MFVNTGESARKEGFVVHHIPYTPAPHTHTHTHTHAHNFLTILQVMEVTQ
jgi:hypothetical protein